MVWILIFINYCVKCAVANLANLDLFISRIKFHFKIIFSSKNNRPWTNEQCFVFKLLRLRPAYLAVIGRRVRKRRDSLLPATQWEGGTDLHVESPLDVLNVGGMSVPPLQTLFVLNYLSVYAFYGFITHLALLHFRCIFWISQNFQAYLGDDRVAFGPGKMFLGMCSLVVKHFFVSLNKEKLEGKNLLNKLNFF